MSRNQAAAGFAALTLLLAASIGLLVGGHTKLSGVTILAMLLLSAAALAVNLRRRP